MRLVTDGGHGSSDRHRILRDLLGELGKNPIVTRARGHPPSTFTEIRAELAPERWDISSTTQHSGSHGIQGITRSSRFITAIRLRVAS